MREFVSKNLDSNSIGGNTSNNNSISQDNTQFNSLETKPVIKSPDTELGESIIRNRGDHQQKVDNLIDQNLNVLQSKERNSQLNSNSFFRNRPFLMNKPIPENNSTPTFPSLIPVNKDSSLYDQEPIEDKNFLKDQD